jgi:hypothetical protein
MSDINETLLSTEDNIHKAAPLDKHCVNTLVFHS